MNEKHGCRRVGLTDLRQQCGAYSIGSCQQGPLRPIEPRTAQAKKMASRDVIRADPGSSKMSGTRVRGVVATPSLRVSCRD
jgi:hypothetical protein